MTNPLSAVTAPVPGPVSLGNFGTPVGSNMASLVAAFGAWTAYTPAWTSTGTAPAIGDGTISGRFTQLSKMGWANGIMTTAAASTYGTLLYRWSLPSGWSAAAAAGTPVGFARIVDSSVTTRFIGVCTLISATTIGVSTHAATADVGATVPMTWASGDSIIWDVAVELA